MQTRLEFEKAEQAHVSLCSLVAEAIYEIVNSNTFGLARLLQVHPELVHHRHDSRIYAVHNSHWNEGDSLLHLAARQGFTHGVELIVEECHANVNAQSGAPYFEQPLHLAAMSDKVGIVEILLRNGAESKCVNHEGMTPFMAACFAGSLHTAHKIMQRNLIVDANTTNLRGQTALWLASSAGLLDIVQSLWAMGAVPSLDIDGRSILHAASLRDHLPVIQFLCKNGIRANQDARGRNPFDYITDKAVLYKARIALLEFEARGAQSAWKLRQADTREFNWFETSRRYEENGTESQIFSIKFDKETEEEEARRSIRERQVAQRAAVLKAEHELVQRREREKVTPLFTIPWPPVIRPREAVKKVAHEKIDPSKYVV